MKKFLSLILTLSLIVSVLAVGGFTANAATSGYLTYTVKNNEAIITNCSRDISGSFTIPKKLGGYPVTEIGNEAFSWCRNLTSIIIPDGVTKIGDKAFLVCTELTSIIIPDSVIEIGESAFSSCDKIKSITIPDNVTKIKSNTFGNCEKLINVTLGKNLTEIQDKAFSWCTSLQSITFPEKVAVLGDEVFYCCQLLSQIVVNQKNQYFTSIDGVLFNKDKTKLILCPEGKFGPEYRVPNGVIEIGDKAFKECINFRSITLGDDVAVIGKEAFNFCRYLLNIYVNSNNEHFVSVDGVLFSKDKKELVRYPTNRRSTSYNIPSYVTKIGESAFYFCEAFTHINIPSNVTEVEDYAFGWCDAVTDINISDSLTTLGNHVFTNCNGLQKILVDENNPNFCAEEGVLFNKDKTKIIYHPAKKSNRQYIIPKTVKEIAPSAFSDVFNVLEFTIPAAVTIIDDGAFGNSNPEIIVHYDGSIAEMRKIKIGKENNSLFYGEWHYYDNGCDTKCNMCGWNRDIEHTYDDKNDKICNICSLVRTVDNEALIKESGKWYHYVGDVKSNLTTLIKFEGKWFYITNGVWDKTVNKLIKFNGKWMYVKDGKWDSKAEDLVKYNGIYFYIKGGKWNSSVSTLFKKNGKWFAIKSGKWYKGETLISYAGKKFYVNKGFAQLSYSGKKKIGSKTYTIKKGKVE